MHCNVGADSEGESNQLDYGHSSIITRILVLLSVPAVSPVHET